MIPHETVCAIGSVSFLGAVQLARVTKIETLYARTGET
jgi:hypothetical protein